jgi:hypothetical protein
MPDRNRPLGNSVVALAGRRIDAEGTNPPRFSLAHVPLVRKRLAELFITENVAAVVCSAACGADLIALEAAGKLGLRRRVVLPFAPERFRETSVVDRPGHWGEVYDRVIAEVQVNGDLVVLPMVASDDSDAYQAANQAIIRETENLAGPGKRMAVIVWEGSPRSDSDATEAFRTLAESAGFSQRFVLTV